MFKQSLRTRLLVTYVGLVLFGMGGLTIWSSIQITNSTLSDYGNSLQVQALFISSRLADILEYNPVEAGATVVESTQNIPGDVTLYGRSEEILFSTADQPIGLIQTETYVVRAHPDGTDHIIASAPVRDDSSIEGYIQINVPQSVPLATVRQRQVALWSVFSAVAIIALVLSQWLIYSLIRPLDTLRQTALRMADGDLGQRVTHPGQDEIGSVGIAFNKMADQVETIVADHRAFASNASHELRTPLTTIGLRTEMILYEALDEETKQLFIEEIDGEVDRMSSLVDDLLLLSRLDSQRVTAGSEVVDAVRLISKICADFDQQINSKEMTIETSFFQDAVYLHTNLTHLDTAFRNLIENSLKYTPAGGKVNISLIDKGNNLQFIVRDNGEGISPEDLEKIGQRFFRADRARTRKIPGTGLGLALVKSILDLYDGTLTIESDGLGQGSRATIVWPQTSASATDPLA